MRRNRSRSGGGESDVAAVSAKGLVFARVCAALSLFTLEIASVILRRLPVANFGVGAGILCLPPPLCSGVLLCRCGAAAYHTHDLLTICRASACPCSIASIALQQAQEKIDAGNEEAAAWLLVGAAEELGGALGQEDEAVKRVQVSMGGRS